MEHGTAGRQPVPLPCSRACSAPSGPDVGLFPRGSCKHHLRAKFQLNAFNSSLAQNTNYVKHIAHTIKHV